MKRSIVTRQAGGAITWHCDASASAEIVATSRMLTCTCSQIDLRMSCAISVSPKASGSSRLQGGSRSVHITALGTLKNGNVFCPLFSAFGPDPIRQRLGLGDGRVLVTTVALYKRKVAALRESLPGLRHVLLIGELVEIAAIPNLLDFNGLISAASEDFEIAETRPEDPALLHFSSLS